MSQPHRTQTAKQEADIFECRLVSQVGSLGEAADSQLRSWSISLAVTLVAAKDVPNLAKYKSQQRIFLDARERFVRHVVSASGIILPRLDKDLQQPARPSAK